VHRYDVAWATNNQAHGEDQHLVMQGETACIIGVADGVSSSQCSRFCSGVLMANIKQSAALCEVLQTKCEPHVAESALRDAFLAAVEKLQTQFTKLRHDIEIAQSASTARRLLRSGIDKVGDAIKIRGDRTAAAQDLLQLTAQMDQKLKAYHNDTKAVEQAIKELVGTIEFDATSQATRLYNRIIAGELAGDTSDCSCTVCLAMFFVDLDDNSRLCTISVGDSVCCIMRKVGRIDHYRLNHSAQLQNYVSARDGVVGNYDLAARKLHAEDIVAIASDGAEVFWTTSEGVAGIPFVKTVRKSIGENNFRDAPNNWLNLLASHQALSDDATLAMARVLSDDGMRGNTAKWAKASDNDPPEPMPDSERPVSEGFRLWPRGKPDR